MPLVQLYIATYNRPKLVLNAINSALKQDFDSYEVIVSDNSTNDETKILVSKIEDKRISYIKRIPSLSAIDHLNAIIKDVKAEYFMIFHDDDVMCENMLRFLVSEIKENDSIVAVGANAFIVVNNKFQKRLFKPKNSKNQKISSRTELALNYLNNSIVPFSSYLYKRKVATNLYLDFKEGGKHSDVSFLMNVCDLGLIINISTPLMYYHFHHNQDSSDFDFHDRNLLLKYIIRTTNFKRDDKLILKYRALSLYSKMLEDMLDPRFTLFTWKNMKIITIMCKVYPYIYFIKLIAKLSRLQLLTFTKRFR